MNKRKSPQNGRTAAAVARKASRRPRMGRIGPFVLIGLAVGLAVAPIPPRIVEAAYSNGVFTLLQPVATSISNIAPFALFDALVVVVGAAWLILAGRDFLRRGRWRALVPIAIRTAVWSAALYLAFLVLWGFNYRRPRLTTRVTYDAGAVTPQAALRLLSTTVDRLNSLAAAAHTAGWPAAGTIDPALAGAFDRTTQRLSVGHRVALARPKRSIFDWYFRLAAVEGMTDPFFLETLVNGELLPFERPFVVAHEWSHLAGLADEGEASFSAWVTCLDGSVPDQYSGWLFLYDEVRTSVGDRDRARLAQQLDARPREDLAAMRARIAGAMSPQLSAAGWRVYDSYLKANRVEAGTASYGEVVRLALGVRLPPVPPLR